MLSLKDVSAHNSQASCWVIIKNQVYDVTDFLGEHPGGAKIILKYAGRDATSAYEPIHPPDALDKNLPLSKHLGLLNEESIAQLSGVAQNRKKTQDELRVEVALKTRPPLSHLLSLADMEEVARKVMSYKALAYYSSASDDEITYNENARSFGRFFFNARVMRPVSKIDLTTDILGYRSSIPVFVSGAALAKLGHPQGEINITKGTGKAGIIQMVSSNASFSYAEIAAATIPSQVLFFQLYKNSDNNIARKRVEEVSSLGYKAIFLTVDAVVPSNRERDIKTPFVLEAMENVTPVVYDENKVEEVTASFGTAGALIVSDDRDMTFDTTIPWLRSVTKLPIVIKGIQCVEDALLAVNAGVDGILLSNHGGRQLDYTMPPMEVLYKLRKHHPEVFNKLEVYIDGGIRRGTDIVKALCLGATAVGLGRPFLYAQSAYGEAGVKKIMEILEREMYTCMRLLGASKISDLNPSFIERVDWQPFVPSKL